MSYCFTYVIKNIKFIENLVELYNTNILQYNTILMSYLISN